MSILDFATGVVVGFTGTVALGLGFLCAIGAWMKR